MTDDAAKARREAAREATFKTAGLFVALGRAGGRMTFSQAEYEEIQARYGGSGRATIHMDVVRAEGQPDEIVLTLVSKPPANAELVS